MLELMERADWKWELRTARARCVSSEASLVLRGRKGCVGSRLTIKKAVGKSPEEEQDGN